MKSIAALAAKSKSDKSGSGWFEKTAKKILLGLFATVKKGHITIEDDGEVYSFGEPSASTDIVAHIYVRNPRVYSRVLLNGSTGSGEAYMDNDWWSPDLTQVIRFFVANMDTLDQMDSRWAGLSQKINDLLLKFKANTKTGSKQNISAHYDLSNDFFKLFLDPSMQYSSAVFPNNEATLAEGSRYKLDRICQQLQLTEDDHLLEIGTGWGGLAIHAAKHYGCQVTTVTISKKQHQYALQWVAKEGLADRVTVKLQDYRDIQGQYDKLVSIEMIEAVGHQFYKNYFSRCSALLKPHGKMLIQAITMADQRYETAKNASDFIKKYIFPGGCLPSIEIIAKNLRKHTDLQIVGLADITFDYAKTLKLWKTTFFDRLAEVKKQGFSDEFIRMWDFYLSYCEGGFQERVISTSQILMAKPECKALPKA